MNIEEFADILDIEIRIIRYPNQNNRYSADFGNRVEFKDSKRDPFLRTYHGNASSPKGAMSDFVQKISGKWLVVEPADKENRREFGIPNLTV